jgi:signal transduction histidine kinase
VFASWLFLIIYILFVYRLDFVKKASDHLQELSLDIEKEVNEIGVPPDTLKAKIFCTSKNMELRFQSKHLEWASSDRIPRINDTSLLYDNKKSFNGSNTFIVFIDGESYYIVKYPEGIFIINPFSSDIIFQWETKSILIVLVVSFTIMILYLLLRKLFSPLKELSNAVERVGEGNYEIDLPVKRTDELGKLGRSINEMSSKINSSIKAKEQLLIDVSHELRSPLTRMRLCLELNSPKQRMEKNINVMDKMVTSLLENYRDSSTFENILFEKINVAELLEDTVLEYEPGERLNFCRPESDIFMAADMEKIQIVFSNLIENALKYSEGIVTVKITEQSGVILITFQDKGIGIPENDLEYIFEPFYRSDPSRSRKTGGFGLGLSICKKIVEAHKGEIHIKSRVNAGTEVILKFNKSDANA